MVKNDEIRPGSYATVPEVEEQSAGNPIWGTITGTLANQTDLKTALNAKATKDVATISADGLMSSTDKTKLDGVQTGATAVSVSATGSATDTVGYITVNGVEKKLAGGSGSVSWGSITGTLSNQSDLNTALGNKQDTLIAGSNITLSGNTISATDTTYSVATEQANGLMSAQDKTDLEDAKTSIEAIEDEIGSEEQSGTIQYKIAHKQDAPATAGTAGQALSLDSDGTTPIWKTIEASAPSNMVTTDTEQTITAKKTFNATDSNFYPIRIQGSNAYYSLLGRMSNTTNPDFDIGITPKTSESIGSNGQVRWTWGNNTTGYVMNLNGQPNLSAGSSDDIQGRRPVNAYWVNHCTAVTSKQDAPATAGTAGQVLKLDTDGTTPIWADESGGSGGIQPTTTVTQLDTSSWSDHPIALSGSNYGEGSNLLLCSNDGTYGGKLQIGGTTGVGGKIEIGQRSAQYPAQMLTPYLTSISYDSNKSLQLTQYRSDSSHKNQIVFNVPNGYVEVKHSDSALSSAYRSSDAIVNLFYLYRDGNMIRNATITGDGSTTSFTATHSFAKMPTIVQVTDADGNVVKDSEITITKTTTDVTVNFTSAPVSGDTYTVGMLY